ncbi:hypothetical protein F503_01576 [Ophiostoma piceae UAMH 11346]|uniref:Corticosteroid-binding protein n=1 Tax=Ophiostoma piceae (strain UAMH 11346) TaxID=1262450 RepID=S3CQD0_OPHP1|nr:hypothetical protein F503_01576 [Ophiostoma piceae UAMH 11346]
MASILPWLASLPARLRARLRVSSSSSRPSSRHLIHTVSLHYLLVVPVALAIATAAVLFAHSDVNVAMLFSQCHARSRLPWLSHLPVIGAPSCFLVSFFGEALASSRAVAVMGVVLAYIGSLLTVSTVEAARICNGPSVLIAYPTGGWLVFDLVGGAMVWQLLIIPAFFRRSKEVFAESEAATATASEAATETEADTSTNRHLSVVAEVVAIPVAVALGYVVPSLAMLATDAPAAIVAWLFFPLYVSAIRQAVRWAIHHVAASLAGRSLHLESDRPSLLAVYAVPIAFSVVAQVLLIYNLVAVADDRKEMTRSTLKFIEIDFFFILLTVLYWILVEAGWRVVAVVLVSSVVLGPGAGLCLGWIYREQQLGFAYDAVPGDAEQGADGLSEETPLLQ